MVRVNRLKSDACFCDECSKVCDSSCRAAAHHDDLMLASARLRGTFSRPI